MHLVSLKSLIINVQTSEAGLACATQRICEQVGQLGGAVQFDRAFVLTLARVTSRWLQGVAVDLEAFSKSLCTPSLPVYI